MAGLSDARDSVAAATEIEAVEGAMALTIVRVDLRVEAEEEAERPPGLEIEGFTDDA